MGWGTKAVERISRTTVPHTRRLEVPLPLLRIGRGGVGFDRVWPGRSGHAIVPSITNLYGSPTSVGATRPPAVGLPVRGTDGAGAGEYKLHQGSGQSARAYTGSPST